MNIVCSQCGNVLPQGIKRFDVTAEKIGTTIVKHYHYCCPCWNRVCGISVESREKFIQECKFDIFVAKKGAIG